MRSAGMIQVSPSTSSSLRKRTSPERGSGISSLRGTVWAAALRIGYAL